MTVTKIKIRKGFISLAFVFLAASCSEQNEIARKNQISESNAVLNYIKRLGIPDEEIVEFSDRYVVQEDIIFPKGMTVPEMVTNPNGRTNQYYQSLVSFSKQGSIKVKIDPSMVSSPNMTNEIYSAINQWNQLLSMGSEISLSVVTGSTFDILIKNQNLGSGVCGQGEFPSGGSVGTTILINKSQIAGNSYDQRQRTIAHEIGHNIGFRHTNWQARGESAALEVPGVPGTDASSIMNGGQCGTGATVLSIKDKDATVALYPTDQPFGFSNSGNYPWIFYWKAPLYTGFGALVGYEVKHTRYDYQGNPIVSSTVFQTTRNYTLPFTQGQYSGQSVVVSVRSQFSDGSFSNWGTYNCTL